MMPPFAYYGGKTRIAERIVPLLPPHGHYVEPFAGSLAVLLAKPPTRHETVNDIDGDLVTFWRVLRDQPDELLRLIEMTPHARLEHRGAYDLEVVDDLERARRVAVLLMQGRTGTLRRTGWRFIVNPKGSNASMSQYLDGYMERLMPAARRLRDVTIECRPGLEIIEEHGKHADVLLYVDPPYFGDRARGYRHEMTDQDEHEALATALHACRASVVLSGYDSPLYDEIYGDWYRAEILTTTSQGGSSDPRVEVLWSNRPLGDARLEGIA